MSSLDAILTLALYRFEHTCVSYDKQISKYLVSLAGLNKFVQDKTPR